MGKSGLRFLSATAQPGLSPPPPSEAPRDSAGSGQGLRAAGARPQGIASLGTEGRVKELSHSQRVRNSLIILIISADFLPRRDAQNELCLSKALLPPKTSTKAKNYTGNKGSLAFFFEYLKENTHGTRAQEDFATNWPLGRDYTWGRGM